MEKSSIERALCENLMIPASVMLGCQDADAHIISQYNLKEKKRKISGNSMTLFHFLEAQHLITIVHDCMSETGHPNLFQ